MQATVLLPQLFKTEYRKIIAVLCKLLGAACIETAEDITNDTFLLASETWGLKGIPDNPVAWLYAVAKNKTKDYLRRSHTFREKVAPVIAAEQPLHETPELDLSAENISDSQLRMIFVICNPAIAIEAQVGLALRLLCGFGIGEIAQAFLTNTETINKRLHRAKEKLRAAGVRVELPGKQETDQRLTSVLATIYLLFNEGYYSSSHTEPLRKELCLEAMRLAYLLLENRQTARPAVNALMSLMCFHASRFEARQTASGAQVLYDGQDRALWDAGLIARGNHYLIESAQGGEVSKYHLEARIAYWHCTPSQAANKWDSILQLYNQLLQLEYSLVAALNRTYALARVHGNSVAIAEAEKLALDSDHLYHALLGNLYAGMDDAAAIRHYERAYALAKADSDREVIRQHIAQVSGRAA